MKSNKLELIILGLIARKPNYAYQLEKLIEKENLREGIDIGFSTIYSALKSLEKEGYLETKIEHQESLPSRKIYSITYAGKEYLRDLMKNYLKIPKFKYSGFDLALLFSDFLTREERRESLNLYKTELDRRIKRIIDELTALDSDRDQKRMTLNRTLELLRAEKKWLKNLYI